MSIAEALSMNPNTLLVISAADLKEFALELMDERTTLPSPLSVQITI